MRLGGIAEGACVAIVREQVSQRGPQGIDTPLLERHAVAREDIRALGDVARHAAAAVCHSLQQAHGHALNIGRKHVGIAVGIQLSQGLADDETGEQYAVVALGCSAQLLFVRRGIGAATSDDQALIGIKGPECLNQQLRALLRHQTTKIEKVGALLEIPLLFDNARRKGLLGIYAIGDKDRLATVGFHEIAPDTLREHNQPTSLRRGGLLPHLDVRAGELSPLGALPVQAVDGGYGSDACALCQRQRHAGALGVVVDHVGMVLDSNLGSKV